MSSAIASGAGGIASGQETVYAFKDESGNRRVEAWLILVANGIYPAAGGLSFNLGDNFRQIVEITTAPVSGTRLTIALSGGGGFSVSGEMPTFVPRREDYTTPTSTRFQMFATCGLSGVGLQELAASGNISGVRFMARVLGY